MKFVSSLIIALGTLFTQPGQGVDSEANAATMELQILEDEVITKVDSLNVKVTSKFINLSRVNYLLYNAKAADPSYGRLEDCEDSTSADFGSRIAYGVLNSKGEIMESYHSIRDDGTRVAADSLKSFLTHSRNKWIKDKIVLNSNQSRTVIHSFSLQGFELKKGKYFIYLFYREGLFVQEYLGEERIGLDEEESNARLFLGCIKSNPIPLIVE